MAKKNGSKNGSKQPMTREAAARIQSAVDRKGGDAGFKARAARAASGDGGSKQAPPTDNNSGRK